MYNLCMNRASLDRESLDRVSWTSTTCQKEAHLKFLKKKLIITLCGKENYLGSRNRKKKLPADGSSNEIT